MTKRKTPEVKAACKPRRRVAFSAPKNAVIKAIVARNASTSPFLRLPLEIRNKIYSELLGDRLLHLEYRDDETLAYLNRDKAKRPGHAWTPPATAWKHVVCLDDCPETRSIRKLHTPDWMATAKRQMYIEANQVLWSTNTFSFNGGIDFKSFMETRTLIQKRTLKKLRLSMDYSLDHKEWNSALNFAVLRSLHGLRHLRLSIDFSLTSRGHVHLKNHFTGPYRTGYFETLEKIATLPLTHVEIGVTGTTYIDDKHDDVIAWSKAEKTECAESLRNLLLDPRGAEVYEQKQMEVKEMRRKLQESMAAVKAARRSWILDRVPIRDTLNGKLNQFSTIPRETKSAENT